MLSQNVRKCDRKFQWTSSADGDSDTLLALDKYMTWFYSQIEGREPYQKMLDSHKEELPSKSSVTFALISYVCSLKPQSVLEVGCGGGNSIAIYADGATQINTAVLRWLNIL